MVDYHNGVKKLPVIGPDEALRLTAILDHQDGDVDRLAGDMWQLEGPLTYYPTPYATFDVSTVNIAFSTVDFCIFSGLFSLLGFLWSEGEEKPSLRNPKWREREKRYTGIPERVKSRMELPGRRLQLWINLAINEALSMNSIFIITLTNVVSGWHFQWYVNLSKLNVKVFYGIHTLKI